MTSTYIIVAIIAYFLGSIPFGYILVRISTGTDVRAQGSGNIGATNVARTGRKGLAIATLILDALKGVLAVFLARLFSLQEFLTRRPIDITQPDYAQAARDMSLSTQNNLYVAMAIAALFAILGHMYPVWLKFKGGKGVATALGVFCVLFPKAVLVSLAIFILVVAITRFVSLGSILAAIFFPIAAYFLLKPDAVSLTL